MKNRTMKRLRASAGITVLMGTLCMISAAHARPVDKPAMTFINAPAEVQNKVYAKPTRAPETTAAQVSAGAQEYAAQTVVGRKIDDMRNQLYSLQGRVAEMADRLSNQEMINQRQAAEYYAAIATINTQLQSGTTPGNPRLVQKLEIAHTDLERFSGNIAALNSMAMDISNTASAVNFLLQSTRAGFSLSGAVEEDHVRLAQLEDSITATAVFIERLLNNVNDDINRTTAYVGTERENLRTLSLAVEKGDMFGRSLANRPFSSAALASFTTENRAAYAPAPASPVAAAAPVAGSVPGGARPLVKIRFDRPDVAFEQPVYTAVNEALQRYPDARFELVAVHPSNGNAAETAIESTRARRDAERVLRSLTQMGLPLERINLSYMPSADATTDEVHLYVR